MLHSYNIKFHAEFDSTVAYQTFYSLLNETVLCDTVLSLRSCVQNLVCGASFMDHFVGLLSLLRKWIQIRF